MRTIGKPTSSKAAYMWFKGSRTGSTDGILKFKILQKILSSLFFSFLYTLSYAHRGNNEYNPCILGSDILSGLDHQLTGEGSEATMLQ